MHRFNSLLTTTTHLEDPIKTFDVKTEPTYGSCCTLDVGNDKAGIPVTKGTQYWVAVTTGKSKLPSRVAGLSTALT